MTVTAYQHISIHCVEDVVLPIRVVFAIVLGMEAKAHELVVNLLLGCEAGVIDIWLYKHCTNLSVSVLGEANQAIGTIREIIVMCLDALKERGEVVIGITEVI